jgi:hypothetical protein
VTLLLIVLALLGWGPGYAAVIGLSSVHLLYFLVQERSAVAFPVQIRTVYFVVTLFGLWPAARFPIYLVLLVGTLMVTFFGRCAIGLALKQMPWNRGRELRLN